MTMGMERTIPVHQQLRRLQAKYWNYAVSDSGYLQHLLSNSITCNFHAFYVYRQIPLLNCRFMLCYIYCQNPVLANSCLRQKFDFTVKVQYLHIPRRLIYCQHPLLANYITCKFIQPNRSTRLEVQKMPP